MYNIITRPCTKQGYTIGSICLLVCPSVCLSVGKITHVYMLPFSHIGRLKSRLASFHDIVSISFMWHLHKLGSYVRISRNWFGLSVGRSICFHAKLGIISLHLPIADDMVYMGMYYSKHTRAYTNAGYMF